MAHRGHEPAMETPAAAYGDEASMAGKTMIHRKTKKGHKRNMRRKGKRA